MSSTKKRTHLPAFLLLFLNESPDYGGSLLAKLKNELPYFLTDSSSVYRSLQELEERGLVNTKWEISEDDTPRKWYYITPEGQKELEIFSQDITQRHANLSFFLTRYRNQKNFSAEKE